MPILDKMNFKNILIKLGLSFNDEDEPKKKSETTEAVQQNEEPEAKQECEAEEKTKTTPKSQNVETPQSKSINTAGKKKGLSLKDNAVDRRDKAIKAIVKSLQQAMGSSLNSLTRMDIWVIIPVENYNPMDYSWADNDFKSELRLAFDNSLLENIGKEYLEVELIHKDKLPDANVEVFENELYYSWNQSLETPVAEDEKEPEVPAEGWISIIEGTGSLEQSPIHICATEKTIYKIGRGKSTRKFGRLRVNDIVIEAEEYNPSLADCNKYVSSGHADIVIHENKIYLRAAEGGCRALGGVATKVYRDEIAHELRDTDSLFLLQNNDEIELGKRVYLLFTTDEPESSNQNGRPIKPMEVDDSF